MGRLVACLCAARLPEVAAAPDSPLPAAQSSRAPPQARPPSLPASPATPPHPSHRSRYHWAISTPARQVAGKQIRLVYLRALVPQLREAIERIKPGEVIVIRPA